MPCPCAATTMRDDELASHGIAGRASRAMGHLPLAGDNGLLAQLKGVARPRKVLVHVNNTNPVLCVYESDEIDEILTAAGVELGEDGMSFVL